METVTRRISGVRRQDWLLCFAAGVSLRQFLRACCLPAALPAATASAVLECSHAGPLFTLRDAQLIARWDRGAATERHSA